VVSFQGYPAKAAPVQPSPQMGTYTMLREVSLGITFNTLTEPHSV